MPVIKEFISLCHGYFESAVPVCPSCGATTDIKRTFTGPPAFKSDKTKVSDKNLKELCHDFGRTDYSNNESTKHTPDYNGIWADPASTGADIAKKCGINVRHLSPEERANPTPIKPHSLQSSLSKFGKFEAIRHGAD